MKESICSVITDGLSGVSQGMRSSDEIVDNIFMIIDKSSDESFDSVKIYIRRAFANLYTKAPNKVDKYVAFHFLATKFEAYLKKLYFMIHGSMVPPKREGLDVTLSDVLQKFDCLWSLKHNHNPEYHKLYLNLEKVRKWRNDESHISPTADEDKIDSAIKTLISMYGYVTASCISDLEEAGF